MKFHQCVGLKYELDSCQVFLRQGKLRSQYHMVIIAIFVFLKEKFLLIHIYKLNKQTNYYCQLSKIDMHNSYCKKTTKLAVKILKKQKIKKILLILLYLENNK